MKKLNHSILFFCGVLGVSIGAWWGLSSGEVGFYFFDGGGYIHTPQGVIGFGEQNSSESMRTQGLFQSWIGKKQIEWMEDSIIEDWKEKPNVIKSRLTENIFFVKYKDIRLFIVKNTSEEEIQRIQQIPIEFQADIWVLFGDEFLENISLETEFVVDMGTQKKAKREWAEKNKKILLNPKENGIVFLTKEKGKWRLYTEK